MAQARVDVLREVRRGNPGEAQLCLQWCRYRYDDQSAEYGYRLVWRRAENGNIQPTRGQARIPSLGWARQLMDGAVREGWGDRDEATFSDATERLRRAGCVVDLTSGYVGWPDREPARRGVLTEQMIQDTHLIQAYMH
jgi:hypothetical protein